MLCVCMHRGGICFVPILGTLVHRHCTPSCRCSALLTHTVCNNDLVTMWVSTMLYEVHCWCPLTV